MSTDGSLPLHCICKPILVVAKIVIALWDLGDIEFPGAGNVGQGGFQVGLRRSREEEEVWGSPFVQTVGTPLFCMHKV